MSAPHLFATPQHATFPTRLRELPHTRLERIEAEGPLAGALERLDPAVAIVGTREPTPAAAEYAYRLARGLAALGVTIVSGGALGIDAAAHEGALDASGKTLVVLPGGIDVAAPSANAALFDRVRATGALVALRPRGQLPRPFSYFARNEVIAALVDDVIVVAAPLASGARNTARWARELGRRLWVVPGAPWDEGLAGNAAELEAGARPVVTGRTLLAALGLAEQSLGLFSGASPEARSPALPRRASGGRQAASNLPTTRPNLDLAAVDPDDRRVLEALQRRALGVDELVAGTGLSVASLRALLLTWTVDGVVIEGPAGLFRLATG